MGLSPNAFSSALEGDRRLDYAVTEAEAMGCRVLSYRKMDDKKYADGRPVHDPRSSHYDWSALGGGRTRAADINLDGRGTAYEVAFLQRYILPLLQSQGLSITAGLNGFVPGHSGGLTHAHTDPCSRSNLGGGVFRHSWAGRPSAPRTGPSIQRLEHAAWVELQKALGVTADALPGPATARALQAALNRQGHKLAVDGAVGALTWKAIQKELGGLVVDGVPGRLTYAALAARATRVVK